MTKGGKVKLHTDSGQRLTAKFCREVKEPGRYGDGHGSGGLSLVVSKLKHGVSKRFQQRIATGGKVTMTALGPFPAITLAEARQRALENVRLRDRGELELRTHAPTFASVADSIILARRAGSKDRNFETSWTRSLRVHMAALADRRIDTITTRDIRDALMPVWDETPSYAKQTRQRVKMLFDFAIGQGVYKLANPAGAQLVAILPKNGQHKTRNHPAVPWPQLPAVIAAMRAGQTRGNPNSKRVAEWVALTACRATMATEMTWDEIDLDSMVWEVPGSRMNKTGRDYRCPITARMLELLQAAGTTSGYVFAQRQRRQDDTGFAPKDAPRQGKAQNRDRPIAELKKTGATDENGIPATAHGWRTTFRTWCQAQGIQWEIAECQISHSIGTATQRAYARHDYLDERREIMERYNEYAISG